MNDIRPIRTDADYNAAFAEVIAFDDTMYNPGTPASDRLDVLVTLMEAYQAKHKPIPKADPIDVLHFAIEDMGHSQAQLAELLGSKSRASEVLNRRRPLTLEMIRAISDAWKIPAASLTGAYPLARNARGRSAPRTPAAKRSKAMAAA